MLGDGADRYPAALSRLHLELLVDERDPELLSDRLAYLARAAGDIARHRDHGHMLLSSLPLRSDTSIGRLAEVCQGLRRDTGQGWLGSKSRSTVYGTITFPTTGFTLGTRFSCLNSYSPGESKRKPPCPLLSDRESVVSVT